MPRKKTKATKSFLTTEDVVFSKGIDTYVSPGSTVHQISIQSDKRTAFFKERPSVQALLLRDTHNPLVEEGDYLPSRSREGEFFLNYEAITLLIERLIRTHKTQAHGLEYNSKNIFVIKNDSGNLEHILSNLNLKDGQDAKIIYIEGIHNIPCYIRNIEGLIRCFIVDPESSDSYSKLARSLEKVFPHAATVLSTGILQKDYYSCSTFAIKTLLYFVKHGQEVFPYIDSVNKKRKYNEPLCEELDLRQLMPTLLKMLQGSLNLPRETLNTIVSIKHQLTLADYYKKYAVTEHNKTYNSAALLKKYSYLDKLNQYFNTIGIKELSDHPIAALPLELTRRHQLYASLPNKKADIKPIHPVAAYEAISAYLDKRGTRPTDPGIIGIFDAIDTKFPQFKQEFKKSFGKSALDDQDYLERLFFVAAHAEIQDLDHLINYHQYLIKLLTLFSNKEAVLAYLYKHAQINNKQAIHDLCQFNLPKEQTNWNQEFWAKLAIDHGNAATKYLALAPMVNQLLLKHKKINPSVSDLEHVYFLLRNFQYNGAEQQKELAALCSDLKLSQFNFDAGLKWVHKGLKTFDFLPQISFSCDYIDKGLDKYSFKKLPINDLRGFFLGEYTSCCQSIEKGGEDCAIHGMTSAFGGFYVLCNKEEIIAQTWAWISTQGQVVFDSWEFINKSQAYLCKLIIIKAAQVLIDAGFSRVLIGTGGHTPDIGLPKVDDPAPHLAKRGFTDSKNQYLIQVSPYKNKAARFEAFSKVYGLSSASYAYLISDVPAEDFVAKLTQLISSNTLPFADFVALISFEYIYSNEFLHQRNQATYQLLLAAFTVYGQSMQHLFSLKNARDVKALAVFLSFEDLDGMLGHIITILGVENVLSLNNQSMQFSDLIYCAVQYDAVKTLDYLYTLNAKKLSYDDLASLDYRDKSLLFFASKNKAQQCFEYILYQMSREQILKILFEPTHSGHYVILHYLAQANAVACFKYLEKVCGTISLKYLLKQQGTTKFSTVQNVNVLVTALYANSLEFLNYILSEPYQFNRDDLLAPEIIEQAINSKSLATLTTLWKLHANEDEWLKTLLYIGRNIITLAYLNDFNDSILFFLDCFNKVDNLHRLLTHGGGSCLNTIVHITNREHLEPITNKLLSIYINNKKQLVALFSPGNRTSFFYGIVFSENPVLIKRVLQYFSEEPQLLDTLLFNQDDLITIVNAVLHYTQSEIKDYHENIIDMIFSFANLEQQKRILRDLIFKHVSPKFLTHLLNIVDTLDDGTFQKSWVTFDKESLLYKSFCSNTSLFPMVFDYYQKFYTVDLFNQALVKNWSCVVEAVINDNLDLLKQIYPAICTDSAKVKELFDLHTQSNFDSLHAFEWLLEQKEVLSDWLIESLNPDKREQAEMTPILEANSTALLWEACTKRLPKIQQQEIAHNTYLDMHIKVGHILASWEGNRYRYKKILLMFESMISCIQEVEPNSIALFTNKNGGGESAFAYSVDSRKGKLAYFILAQCTQDQRQQLLMHYQKTSSKTKQDKIAQVTQYIANLAKFDVLVSLKSELLLIMQSQNGMHFFQDIDKEPQQILALLNPFTAKHIIYAGENDSLCFITEDEINTCWTKVPLALSTLSQPAYKALSAKYQGLMDVEVQAPAKLAKVF